MQIRGQDCVWFWMNFDYELKELRKQITLEKVNIRNEEKGDKPLHTYLDLTKYLEKNPRYPETRLHAVTVGQPARADRWLWKR